MAHRLLREEDGHTDLHIFLKVNFENVVARLVRIIDNGQTERRREPNLLLVHPEELTRFGESIGINKSLCSCTVGLDTGRLSMRDPPHGPINDQYYQCVQSIYRGIESHTSITSLTLDLECMGIPVNESLPRFNFQDAPITLNVEKLKFRNRYSDDTIYYNINLTDDDSTLIIQALRSFSQVKSLDISCLPINESAFPRIISACPSPMKRLTVSCDTAQHCSTLADYLQSNRLMVSHLDAYKGLGTHTLKRSPQKLTMQEASTIINGLKNGAVPLKTLILICRIGNTYFNSVRDLLCDTTSIESICSSNHTLLEIKPCPKGDLWYEDKFGRSIIENSLKKLNIIENKEKVIREKIARYYFVGDFDVSPLARLPVSAVPSVLGMIKGKKPARQSAIFRLLKSIPDLCNVGSRVNINVRNDEDIYAVKDGACGNKRRRKT